MAKQRKAGASRPTHGARSRKRRRLVTYTVTAIAILFAMSLALPICDPAYIR